MLKVCRLSLEYAKERDRSYIIHSSSILLMLRKKQKEAGVLSETN